VNKSREKLKTETNAERGKNVISDPVVEREDGRIEPRITLIPQIGERRGLAEGFAKLRRNPSFSWLSYVKDL
jgi:hypothetical protein